jgi:hypothetical protein
VVEVEGRQAGVEAIAGGVDPARGRARRHPRARYHPRSRRQQRDVEIERLRQVRAPLALLAQEGEQLGV